MLREGETTPAIYTDEAFGKTNHWELSTSQLSSPFVDGWGYGEGMSAVSCCKYGSLTRRQSSQTGTV
jgi:hypothetical protein